MAIVQNIDLNLIPDSEAVVVKVNQYDDGTGRIQAHLYLNDTAYTPASGATVRIEGTKPDKHGFSYTASISGNTVTANLTTQMTAVAGRTRAQIIVEEPSGKTGTFAFWLDVQAAALADDTDISDTELPAIMDLARQNAAIASAAAESAAASATTAQTAAQGTEGFAEDAEAYAVGKRGGTDVPSTDPTYHNNSKYYAGQAGTAAQSAQASAEAAAVWSEHPPYIGANGNWYIYDTTTHAFADSGIDASITVQVADVTMLDPTAAPYVTNTGSNTDPIFHLFLPRGQTGAPGQDGEDGVDGQDGQDGEDGVGIASIVKTGSQTVSGRVVDTYTITYTDDTTTTYQIVNGKDGEDGQGSGDMTKAVYDPNNNRYPLNIMTGATATSIGTVGFPPVPGIGDQDKFFKGDGTWADTGSGDANAEEIAPVEDTTTASQAYAVNDFLIHDGKLYRITSSIAIGGTITPGTNCTETSVSEAFVRKTGDTMTGAFTVGSRFAATAVGSSSLGNGNQVIASGSCAHAEGNRSVASASYSHAEGLETSAGYSYQHVIGQYNNNKSTDAFEIGNGANSSSRSNALEVTWDGDLTAAGEITDGQGNVLSKIDNRVSTIPTASVDNVGDIVQFIGATTGSYTNGYFYKCIEADGTLPYDFSGSAVLYNDEIHILGGRVSGTSRYHYKWDGVNWVSASTLPYDFGWGAAVVYNNEIHLLGGADGQTNHYKWDGANWVSVSTLPYNFYLGSAVVYNNEIHILGGSPYITYHYKWNGLAWTSVSTLPYSFANGCAVVYNNELHIMGGANSSNRTSHYKWDGSAWTSASVLPYSLNQGSSVVFDNKIHILGGSDESYQLHYAWNGSEWSSVSTLPYSYYSGQSVIYKDKIHLLGGNSSSSRNYHYEWNGTAWISLMENHYAWTQTDVQPSGGGSQDIFIAEYDVTTYADIDAAYTAGKFILVSRSLHGTTIYSLSDKASNGTYYFLSFSNTMNMNYGCFVTSAGTWGEESLSYASLSSPTFSGTPKAPTAAAGTNTTQIATTAFVNTAIGSAPKMPNYSALMALAVVSGTTIEFDNPYPVSEQSKLDESIIDGPYINNVMAGIEDVEIANNKIVYTLSDDSADTCLAIIWVRYAGQLLLNDLVETSLQRTYSNDSISSSSTSDEIKAKFKSSGGQLTAYFGSHGITVTDDCIYSYSRSESISESGSSHTYYYANASYTSDNITETTEVIVARFGGIYS